MIAVSLVTTLIVLLLPQEAWAWGVGAHLSIASRLLSDTGALTPGLQMLLASHPNDFLYGCMSADITIGKKYTHYLRNCHSWNMGNKVLASARTAGEQACAYGYLVHLAADSVAHSYFIPFKTIRTFNTALHNHAYWEMRVESTFPASIWTLAHDVASNNYRENDQLLRGVLSNTLFSFGTNKRIFNSIILLNRIEKWQQGLQLMAQRSRFVLDPEDQAEYLELAYTAAHSILVEGEKSPFRRADPTGERALRTATAIRRSLRHLWLEGKLPITNIDRQLADYRRAFRDSITHPEQLLDLVAED